jgi:exonuclease VII small subunit
MICNLDGEAALAASFAIFRDGAELTAALTEAAAGRGMAPAMALALAVAHIRRLEATVRRLEAAQGPAVAHGMGGRP